MLKQADVNSPIKEVTGFKDRRSYRKQLVWKTSLNDRCYYLCKKENVDSFFLVNRFNKKQETVSNIHIAVNIENTINKI
jgi:hypothetical protein